MSISNIAILVLVICAILFSLGSFVIYLLRRQYTRERFAFCSTASLIALASAMITSFLASTTILNVAMSFVNSAFNLNISIGSPDWTGQILSVIVFISILSLIYAIHAKWDGVKSVRQADLERLHEQTGLLSDTIAQLKSFVGVYPIVPAKLTNKDQGVDIFLKEEIKSRPWHVHVAELFTLTSKQYKINIDEDWYEEDQCFISKFGKNNKPLVIKCLNSTFTDDILKALISFVKLHINVKARIIIAIRNEFKNKHQITFKGYVIEVRYEEEMLNGLINFSDYYDHIKRSFETKDIAEGCGFSLKDIYVQSSTTDINGIAREYIEDYLLKWSTDNTSKKHLAILGEYGQGKSVLALKYAYDIITRQANSGRIPIIIELRGKSPRNLDTLEILANWASNYRIDPQSLIKLHSSGKLIIIFEGFDEMDLVGDAEMRFNHFQRLWEFAIPSSKIIITGRPNFFLDDVEMRQALGIHTPTEGRTYCEALYLNSFNRKQIEEALRATKKTVRDEILSMYDESGSDSNFCDLLSRPSTLFLVSIIWEERNLSTLKEKINSSFVINEFMKHSYTRQLEKRYKTVLTSAEREFFMHGIAVGMTQAGSYSNQINANNLNAVVLKLLSEVTEDDHFASDIFEKPNNISLKNRIKDSQYTEDSILTDIRSCGILTKDLTRMNYFKFAHKSFLEVLVSAFISNSIIPSTPHHKAMCNIIKQALEIDYISIRITDEISVFVSEMLLSARTSDQASNPEEYFSRMFKIIFPIPFFKNFPKFTIFTLRVIDDYLPLIFIPVMIVANILPVQTQNFEHRIYYTISLSIIITLMTFVVLFSKKLLRTKKLACVWYKCCKEFTGDDSRIDVFLGDRSVLYLSSQSRSFVVRIKNMIARFLH